MKLRVWGRRLLEAVADQPGTTRAPERGWINEDRFAAFRAALAYARGHFSQAAHAHAKVNAEEAYWIYMTIRRGFERQERESKE